MRPSLAIADLIGESAALLQAGAVAEALQRGQQALVLARTAHDPPLLASALVCLASARFRMGQYPAAQALSQEAIAYAGPETPAGVEALLQLGACAGATGSIAQAETHFRRASDLARELGHDALRLRALHNLAAGVYITRGQFDLALSADREAYGIACEQGLGEWAPYPLITIAWVHLLSGQRERARAVLGELAHLVGPGSVLQGYHLCLEAHLAFAEGDLERAQRGYAQARSIAEATGEPWISIAVRLGMSRCCRATGDGPAALQWADDAVRYATRVGYRQELGNALIERARAAWPTDLPLPTSSAAELDLRAAIDLLDELGAAFDRTRARFLLAALLHRQEHDQAPALWLDAAREMMAGGFAFLLEQERAVAFPLLASYAHHADPAVAQAAGALLDHLQRVPPAPLRVVALGRWEVWQGAQRIAAGPLRQRQAEDLLALLLLARSHSLSFDQTAEALWPERAPASARTSLHHATSALRRALEPDLPDRFPSRYLEVEESQVTLHLPPGSTLDVERFEEHCAHGEWEAALALYEGELLPKHLYADWTIAPRQRLSLLFQRALLEAAEARLAAGQLSEALDACNRALALEPWQERAVLIGMRTCLAMDDRAGALRLYKRLEQALRQDLDTAPSDDLQALYRSLIR
ncbi:MAG: hypothetical protein JXA09_17865 [Anaerolineae bacterium]|nr:hypothetical protein [Anaerolineae bacterium]